ncbi:hypothetical protein [Paenibacillus hamazuiensis]|uniref:hypothetical protein n=1 Tax=Paenibacillus hamazuiensis TaxID=2936508 RepID=UPI00200EDBAB|nr:hypothetical protein [Paenibacillus hamazuiensis]
MDGLRFWLNVLIHWLSEHSAAINAVHLAIRTVAAAWDLGMRWKQWRKSRQPKKRRNKKSTSRKKVDSPKKADRAPTQ